MLYVIVGVIAIAIGFIFGVACTYFGCYAGKFIINENDPEKDIYRLEFDKLSEVHNRQYILFVVKHDS